MGIDGEEASVIESEYIARRRQYHILPLSQDSFLVIRDNARLHEASTREAAERFICLRIEGLWTERLAKYNRPTRGVI